jgi:thiamine-phosphate pyrophosphorylase
MTDSLAQRKLARAAARLSSPGGAPLVLFTDDEQLADPLAAARLLPRGSMIVVRSRDDAHRRALTVDMMRIARMRDLTVLVAADAALAALADGLHLPEARAGEAVHWRARRRFLITASAHSLSALCRTKWIDAVFLSPVFPTKSHPGRPALTAVRANMIARAATVPVYALGGVNLRNANLLSSSFSGIAAIAALAV